MTHTHITIKNTEKVFKENVQIQDYYYLFIFFFFNVIDFWWSYITVFLCYTVFTIMITILYFSLHHSPLDGVDHLIRLRIASSEPSSFVVCSVSSFKFLSCHLHSCRLTFAEAPGAASRLIRFSGSQRDIGKHPFLREKEERRGFEPPTLGAVGGE